MRRSSGLFFLAWIAVGNLLSAAPSAPRLSGFTATASSTVAGETVSYTVNFSTAENVAANGKFTINFPGKFDLTGVTTGSLLSPSNGGLVVTNNPGDDNDNYVTLTRDGSGTVITAGTEISIQFNGVVNSDSTGSFELELRHSGSNEPFVTTNISITSDVLNTFVVTNNADGPIANQTAGVNFSVKIVAEDQYGNTVTSYNGIANLTDQTSTLTPASIGFTNGVANFTNANITKAQNNVSLTATDGAVNGTSNLFNVGFAAIDHFAVTSTADGNIGTQIAGVNFSIKITAQDAFDNIVSNWTGTVDLSDNTGTLSPTSAAIASNGTVTVSTANIEQSGAAVNITASSGGSFQGTSNNFQVNPAAIDHFMVTDATDAAIATQTAGEDFTIKITAKDQFENTVTAYTGNIDLTDDTGTLTPQTTTISSAGAVTIANANITLAQASVSITATENGGGITGTSNTFNVDANNLSYFVVTNTSGTDIPNQVAATTFAFRITARDQFDNNTAWTGTATIEDSTGSISPASVDFSAETFVDVNNASILTARQNNRIKASSAGGAEGSSNEFDVAVGTISQVKVLEDSSGNTAEVGGLSVTTDSLVVAHAAGFDDGNNYVEDVSASWSVSGGIGQILDDNGSEKTIAVLDPKKPGTGILEATHTATATSDGSGDIIVSVGVLQNVIIVEGSSGDGPALTTKTLNSGDNMTIHAAGYDANLNYLGDESVTWSQIGGIGSFSTTTGTNTVFTAGTAGTGVIKADHSSDEVVDDYTDDITILAGNLDYILLRTAANGGGSELNTHTMTADESLTIYAAGYDSQDNFIGDQNTNWTAASGTASPGTGTSTVYSPTTVGTGINVSGTVVSTVISDAVLVDVTAGASSGPITLTPTPSSIEADGTSTANITSSAVTDQDGNPVGAGKQFTISLSKPASFGTILNDVNGALSGVQVETNSSSILDFTFQAGTNGGNVTVFASSVNGSAYGNTEISLNALEILSVTTPHITVSRGQQNAQVSMTIENRGESSLTIQSAALVFKRASDPQLNWNGISSQTRVDGETTLAGGGASTVLNFEVDIKSDATIDNVIIDGVISATTGSATISDSGSTAAAPQWTVQKNASIQIESVTAVDTVVDQGSAGHQVSVVLSAEGGDGQTADVNIDDVTLKFMKSAVNVSNQYSVAAIPGNPTVIPGDGTSVQLDFNVDVLVSAESGTITLDAEFTGSDINSGTVISDLDGTNPPKDTWQVQTSTSFDISSVSPNQPAVSAGMAKPWTITVQLNNASPSTIDPDSVFINLYKGSTNVTSEYTIVPPDKSVWDQNLGPNTTRDLVFTINSTGTTLGAISIRASFLGTDLGTSLTADRFDGNTTFQVQNPANIEILGISAPAMVTQNQTKVWRTKVLLRNVGEAGASINFANSLLNFLDGDTTGTIMTNPTSLAKNPPATMLAGGATDTLIYTIAETGSVNDTLTIGAGIQATDVNSNVVLNATSQTAQNKNVWVQTPAQLVIDSTVVNGPLGTLVNTGQEFTVDVKLRNAGQETINNALVLLASDQLGEAKSTITQQSQGVTIPGLGSTVVPITVVASNLTIDTPGEVFTVSFGSATAANTGLTPPVTTVDDTEEISIQSPAELEIESVIVSTEPVFANQNTPWIVELHVKNNGTARANVDPRRENLRFEVDGTDNTSEYTIVAPEDLVIDGSFTEIISYTINRTGTIAGTATITANLTATDGNTLQTISVPPNSATKEIEQSSSISITGASLVGGYTNIDGHHYVNTDQNFKIRVNVKNLSTLPVTDAVIKLFTEGQSNALTIAEDSLIIGSINANQTASVEFNVTAGSAQKPGGEFIRAELISAMSGGNPAEIDPGSGNRLRIRTQTPAQLGVSAESTVNSGLLTFNQPFKVTATVKNSGQASYDESGELLIEFPEGYTLADSTSNPVQVFNASSPKAEWVVIAPETESTISGGDPVVVSFSTLPNDLNANTEVQTVNPGSDTLFYNTSEVNFVIESLQIIEPVGAQDRILSTESEFTIRLTCSGWKRLISSYAVLKLPNTSYQYVEGYSDTSKSITEIDEQGYFTWKIKAVDPAGAQLFQASINGKDGVDSSHTDTESIQISTVERARIYIEANAPQSLAVGQGFTVSAAIRNSGTAGITEKATLQLELGTSGVTLADGEMETKTDSINNTVEWDLIAPQSTSTNTNLTVRFVDPTPIDENSNLIAIAHNDRLASVQFDVRQGGVLFAENFEISSPIGARNHIVSTDQSFVVRANINWQDVTDITAEFKKIQGNNFEILNATKSPLSTSMTGLEEISWQVTAPSNSGNGNQFQLNLQGKDASSGETVLDSSQILIDVVSKASFTFTGEIISPESATDRIVAPSQIFIVAANFTNDGEAGLRTGDLIKVNLLPPTGYIFVGQGGGERTLSGNGIVTWELQAPDGPSENQGIELKLSDVRPKDENSEQDIIFSTTLNSIPIVTEANSLKIREMATNTRSVIAKGQENVELLNFELTNQGDEAASSILLSQLVLRFVRSDSIGIPANTILNGLTVSGQQASTNSLSNSEVILTIDPVLEIAPRETIPLVVLGLINENAEMSNFSVLMNGKASFTAKDMDSNTNVEIKLVDISGAERENLVMKSQKFVVVGKELKDNFYNHPNPFTPLNDQFTSFTYTLENATEVKLQIFTLHGELVYSVSYAASTPEGTGGGSARSILWDGKNGAGQPVLSGIYVAYLSAGSEVAKTTVAVIR